MVTERYVRFGKQYRKLGRMEIIKNGACHSLCGGELYPIVGVDTVGDVPASFSDQREFYNPILKGDQEGIIGDCPLCKTLDPVHCERTDIKKFSECIECGRLILKQDFK